MDFRVEIDESLKGDAATMRGIDVLNRQLEQLARNLPVAESRELFAEWSRPMVFRVA